MNIYCLYFISALINKMSNGLVTDEIIFF